MRREQLGITSRKATQGDKTAPAVPRSQTLLGGDEVNVLPKKDWECGKPTFEETVRMPRGFFLHMLEENKMMKRLLQGSLGIPPPWGLGGPWKPTVAIGYKALFREKLVDKATQQTCRVRIDTGILNRLYVLREEAKEQAARNKGQREKIAELEAQVARLQAELRPHQVFVKSGDEEDMHT